MEVRVKAWIENDGNVVFGEGRRLLLEHVAQTGSLNKAAKVMKMSYRAAWGKLKDTEKRLGFKLLESKTGGSTGGGSVLTEKGKKLLKAFAQFEDEIKNTAENQFNFILPIISPGKK